MSKLLTIKLDVTKIPRERIFEGKSGKYIDLDIWINDEPDKYGNDCSANIRQTKEERDDKARKIYVGNGKTVFGWDGEQKAPQRQASPKAANDAGWDKFDQQDDDESEIPF